MTADRARYFSFAKQTEADARNEPEKLFCDTSIIWRTFAAPNRSNIES